MGGLAPDTSLEGRRIITKGFPLQIYLLKLKFIIFNQQRVKTAQRATAASSGGSSKAAAPSDRRQHSTRGHAGSVTGG